MSLGLAKLAELRIAHKNIRCENIFLDYKLQPYFSQFESSVEYAAPELLFEDLKALGETMKEVLKNCISHLGVEWVQDITCNTTLLDLRQNLYNLANSTAKGEIATVEELINSLIYIYPELLIDHSEHSENFTPPTQTLLNP